MTTQQITESEIAQKEDEVRHNPDTLAPPEARPLTPSERILANNKMLEVLAPVIKRDHVISHKGSSYVKVAGGIAIANALGFTISTTKPIYTEDEEGQYYESTARLLDNGRTIAEAVGYLGMDEPRWATEPIYSKRSMAQTRAVARLCRQNFAHFYISIGASDTAWEEIPSEPDVGMPISPKKVTNKTHTATTPTEGIYKIKSCTLKNEGENSYGKWYLYRVVTMDGQQFDSFNIDHDKLQLAITNQQDVSIKQVSVNDHGHQAKYIEVIDSGTESETKGLPDDDIPF